MWLKAAYLGLQVAILLKGTAICSPEPNDNHLNSLAGGGSPNIVLDPDKSSILATLEHLQRENERLRQDFEQSNSELKASVQALQAENSQLRRQQNASQTMVLNLFSEMGDKLRENLELANEQVQSKVSELVRFVEEIKDQQEAVMAQEGLMQSVLDVVKEFEDETHKLTSSLDQLQDRLGSVEGSLLQLQVEGCGCENELNVVEQRMEQLESLMKSLQAGRSSPRPFTSPTTTSIPSPTTNAAIPQLLFNIPRDRTLHDNSLITSIFVTKEGKLITGDIFQNKLKMSSMENPKVVRDTYDLHKPFSILQLLDGTIAVAKKNSYKIALLRIADDRLRLVRYIRTELPYHVITQGPDNTLIGCTDLDDPRLDIINLDGEVQRTLLQDADFLVDPFCLRRFGEDVYVSDWTSERVFRVNVYTGEVKFTVGNLDLSDLEFYQPRKFDIDGHGNLYINTGGRVCNPDADGYFCVIQVTQAGSWKVMDSYVGQDGAGYPYGLKVASSQIIISWGLWDYIWSSELTAYSLPKQEEMGLTTTETPSKKTCGHLFLPTIKPEEVATNVALNKPALQSTYHGLYGHPENAVDGSKATAIGQCTHTADIDSNPNRWWRVDLMGLFEVEAVVITNRGDCCGFRLSDFNIYVMRTLQDPSESFHDPGDLCVHHSGPIAQGATVRLECDQPMVGQYVSLVLPTDSVPLHFCELEVLGKPASGESSVTGITSESTPSSTKTTLSTP